MKRAVAGPWNFIGNSIRTGQNWLDAAALGFLALQAR